MNYQFENIILTNIMLAHKLLLRKKFNWRSRIMSSIIWINAQDVVAQQIFQGICVRPLWQGEDGAKAMVVEIAPGAQWEGIDSHDAVPEEIFVVSGTFNDGTRNYPSGSFIHHPVGSSHIPQSSTGCTLFLFYPAVCA